MIWDSVPCRIFDDIGGEGAKPEGQVEFLNYLNKEFIHKNRM